MLRGAALGWSTGRRSLGEAPARGNWLPARSRDLALHLARGRGSPPLRFASTRGPPSSTNTSTDVYGEARCRAVGGSERAAADARWKIVENATREQTSQAAAVRSVLVIAD